MKTAASRIDRARALTRKRLRPDERSSWLSIWLDRRLYGGIMVDTNWAQGLNEVCRAPGRPRTM